MVGEVDYYPRIARFLGDKYHCFVTKESAGCGHVGRADVVGIRDIGGRTVPDVEVLAVEAKIDRGNFCKNLGQALGYSLFADKCYLAVPLGRTEGFSLAEKEMATRLGVGLIDCGKKKVREIVTSSSHEPIRSLWMNVLWNLDYVMCVICGNVVESPDEGETTKMKRVREEGRMLYVRHLLEDDGKARKLLFTEKSKSERPKAKYSYMCNDCLNSVDII